MTPFQLRHYSVRLRHSNRLRYRIPRLLWRAVRSFPRAARGGLLLRGVPIFPNTPEGQAERLAYYEARKLNHLLHSLLDHHDVIRGRETPAERRSREGRATSRRR
jgi:hypothetical protein